MAVDRLSLISRLRKGDTIEKTCIQFRRERYDRVYSNGHVENLNPTIRFEDFIIGLRTSEVRDKCRIEQ